MASDSVARILVDEDGNFVAVSDGGSPVRGFVGLGVDGGTARYILVDPSGRTVMAGAGVAGTPAGGVLSVQGVSGGTVVPVGDGGGSLTVDTPQLPAALVGGRLDANVGAWLGATTPTVGQKAMAASVPVTVASDQTAIPVAQGSPPWAVKGTDAVGVAPTQNPVLTAVVDPSGNIKIPLVDALGGGLTTIDWGHYKVHASKHFFIADWTSVSGAGTAYNLLLVTNASFPHLTLSLSAQAAFTYELYEGTTTSSDGTAVTGFNNNRNSAGASVMTAFHTPTVTAVGTLLARRQLSSGAREGGGEDRETELILKTGTKYLLRFIKTDAGSGTVAWTLNWYE